MNKLFPIKILSKQDDSILEEFTLDDMEKAYSQMKYYENIGIDAELLIPGAAHSLALSLNIAPLKFITLENELDNEISEHND